MNKSKRIYLDNHATTAVDPKVLEAMQPYWTELPGNAASWHVFGSEALDAVETARGQIGDLIGCESQAIYFTSGATESINLALKGVVSFYGEKRNEIITLKTEHPATLDTCKSLEERGFEVKYLGVYEYGKVGLGELEDALSERTLLVSILHANNEIGTIQDLGAIGGMARKYGAFFHVDAAQSLGKVKIDVEDQKIDLLSATAHKLHGPIGVGCLYVRRRNPRVRLYAQMQGGGHEKGLRSGTLNVPGIVGFGKACEIAKNEMVEQENYIKGLRDQLWELLKIGEASLLRNGDPDNGLAGNLSVTVPGVDAMNLLSKVPEIAMSAGSACSSAIPAPSHVLRAIGVAPELATSTIRIGLSRFNTEEEVRYVAERMLSAIQDLRENPGSDDLPESCLVGV
jgi:cysteine desulfurase